MDPRAPDRNALWPFALLGLLLLAFSWPAFKLLSRVYANDGTYSHGFLVPFVSVALARLAWRRHGAGPCRPAWTGVPTVLAGVALVALGLWYDAALGSRRGTAWMCSSGLIVLSGGLVLSVGGWRNAFILWFPLLYLLFGVVWPGTVVDSVSLPLRRVAAVIASKGVAVTGIPVLREGNVLHLAGTALGVDDACSGLHSLGILLATACGVAYWQELRIRRGALLIFAAPVVAVLSNSLRVSLTAVFVHRFGMQFASGARREVMGYACFALGLGTILGMGRALRPTRVVGADAKDRAKEDTADAVRLRFPAGSRGPAVAAALILFCGTAFLFAVRRQYVAGTVRVEPAQRRPFSGFPAMVGDFTSLGGRELSDEMLRMLKPSDSLYRKYLGGAGGAVECTLLYWDPAVARRLPDTAAPHNPDVCFASLGGKRLEAFDGVVDIGDTSATMRVFQEPEGARIVLSWQKFNWQRVPKPFLARLAFLCRTWRDPIQLGARHSVIISTHAAGGALVGQELAGAKQRCVRFAKAIAPLLLAYGIDPDERDAL